MEHYDWNEYHANLVAQREAEAKRQATGQGASTMWQTEQPNPATHGVDEEAPEPQPATQQAPQPEPQQTSAPQPAVEAQDAPVTEQPAPQSAEQPAPETQPASAYGAAPAPNPSDQTSEQEPPVSWDYSSSASASPRHAARDAAPQDASPAPEKKARTGRTILIIVLVVLAIAVVIAIAYLVTSGSLTSGSSSTEAAGAATPADDVAEDLAYALSDLTVTGSEDDYSYDDEYEYDYDEEDEEAASYDSIDEFLESYGTFEEVTITGSGNEVIDLTVPDVPMLVTATIGSSDDDDYHYFFIYTLDDNDEVVSYFAIDSTPYSGTTTSAAGYGYTEGATKIEVDTTSEEEWTITLSPMSSMEALKNGGTYSGDGVYYIDADEISSLDITYEPEDDETSFSFSVISPDEYDSIYGSYGESVDETIEWTESICFVAIESEGGEWSVSW